MLEIRTVFQELSFKKFSSPTEPPATESNICVKHLQITYGRNSQYLLFLLRPSIAFISSGLSSKSNTWKKGKNHINSPKNWHPPGDWRTFLPDGDKKSGQGSLVCPQLPGEQAWEPLLNSHLSFPHPLLLCPSHKRYCASVLYPSKWTTWKNKQIKIFFYQACLLDTPDSILNLS